MTSHNSYEKKWNTNFLNTTQKLSKLDEPDTQNTAGGAGTSS